MGDKFKTGLLKVLVGEHSAQICRGSVHVAKLQKRDQGHLRIIEKKLKSNRKSMIRFLRGIGLNRRQIYDRM